MGTGFAINPDPRINIITLSYKFWFLGTTIYLPIIFNGKLLTINKLLDCSHVFAAINNDIKQTRLCTQLHTQLFMGGLLGQGAGN